MTEVFLLTCLGTRQTNLISVDDDYEVTSINMWGVLRLVLTLKDGAALVATRPKTWSLASISTHSRSTSFGFA